MSDTKSVDRGERSAPLDCSVHIERGKEFRFNDHVYAECMIAPKEKRSGRLLQVRVGCGQFGSNVYFVRLRDGSLMTWENVMIRHVNDDRFIDLFYRMNGMLPPIVQEQDKYLSDSETVSYSMSGGKWPETGFIVEAPKQPETPGMFAMIITKPNRSRLRREAYGARDG